MIKNSYLILLIFLIYVIVLLFFIKKYNLERFSSENALVKKKIAFCFLIYEEIYNEELWYDFFKNVDKSKYSVYIHYKIDKPLKYFNDYKLKTTIETCWGCLSIVQAQNLILKEALKDDMNQHFIWVSDSCVPLKSFDSIYTFLDTNKSYYNKSPDSQVFPRANKLLNYIERKNIKKAAMPSIINRKHAELFINNNENINSWFTNIDNVDEIVYITLLYHNNLQNELVITQNIAAGAIIFSQWGDMSNQREFKNSKKNKKNPYSYLHICPEELDYLINSDSLVGRKFMKNCSGLNKLKKIYNP